MAAQQWGQVLLLVLAALSLKSVRADIIMPKLRTTEAPEVDGGSTTPEAGDMTVPDLDASFFEIDTSRRLKETELHEDSNLRGVEALSLAGTAIGVMVLAQGAR
eukprot:CAMPEP_0115105092 /NCGR_PEP_ID=MMETSP0227-20121206/35753_1 /TAXON_ID=89957 /ORGANISM="Polarella glacialis, Strain CCMP 1383" /LENGTH=103 /DNA_ID=CAMNT_0002502231 /DNA_START=67 /DNA_END=378 /DNA_ORIENTATION=-